MVDQGSKVHRLGIRDVLALDWPNSARSRRGGLSTHALVLAVLADHADGYGIAFPKLSTVADALAVGSQTVERVCKDLDDWGMIDRVRLRSPVSGNYAGYLTRVSAYPPVPDRDHLRTPCTLELVGRVPDSWFSHHQSSVTGSHQSSVTGSHQSSVTGQEALTVEAPTLEETLGDESPGEDGSQEEPGNTDPSHQPEQAGDNRDLIFEMLCEVCNYDWSNGITRDQRGRVNNACKQLKEIGAEPGEIRRRARVFRQHFPDAVMTPQAITGNWAQLVPGIKRPTKVVL